MLLTLYCVKRIDTFAMQHTSNNRPGKSLLLVVCKYIMFPKMLKALPHREAVIHVAIHRIKFPPFYEYDRRFIAFLKNIWIYIGLYYLRFRPVNLAPVLHSHAQFNRHLRKVVFQEIFTK